MTQHPIVGVAQVDITDENNATNTIGTALRHLIQSTLQSATTQGVVTSISHSTIRRYDTVTLSVIILITAE